MSNVIVIGGGASGIVSAIYAARSGCKVTLLEKNKILGKKLLMTGNGKCNYWNKDQSLRHYHSSDSDILLSILTKENQEEIETFFYKLGIIPRIKDGYCYPYSNQATSIQTALIKEAELSGVNIVLETAVLGIEKDNDVFRVITDKGEFFADKVILATGSKACPKTGSDGFGYSIAKRYGHTIIPVLPALVQLKSSFVHLKDWHGVRSDVEVTLLENKEVIGSEVGEIQLTDYGISGICTFCLSGRVARGLYLKRKETILINFLYPFGIKSKEEAVKWLNNRNDFVCDRSLSDLLDGVLNYKLVNLILKVSNVKRDVKWNELSLDEKYLLCFNLISFKLDIIDTNSFDQAQTCTGGISLREVDLSTMMSLKVDNLYFTGELLDVDGDCGGYNLSFAWISGMLAGRGVSND